MALDQRVGQGTVRIPKLTVANTVTKEQLQDAFEKTKPLEGIFWGKMIDKMVIGFKSTYPNSWTQFKERFNDNEEIATQKLRENIFVSHVIYFNEYMDEVKKRNQKRIDLELSKTAKDYKPYIPDVFVDRKFMHDIMTEEDKKKYLQSLEMRIGLSPLKPTEIAGKLPYRFFIITEEPDWWVDKITEYESYGISMDKEKAIKSFNALKPVNDIKEFMIRSGFIQTFSNADNRIIDLIYFNDNFRVRTYYLTPAYIKNGFAKDSISCVNNKDSLYTNLLKTYPSEEVHKFMARSIIVDSSSNMETVLTADYLFQHLVSPDADNYDDAITQDPIYIARPVAYKADDRYRAAIGNEILILNGNVTNQDDFNNKIAQIKQLLRDRYKTIIISKFIKTKLINGHTFHLRGFTFASVTKLKDEYIKKDGSEIQKTATEIPYFMHAFLNHKFALLMSSKKNSVINTLTNYNDVNTHNFGEYEIFPDDIKEEIDTITNVNIFSDDEIKSYLGQMVEIMRKVFTVLAKDIQIYPETESGFSQFGFDFMIGANGKVYLPEINQEGGFYNFTNRNQINPSKYLTLNNGIQSMIIKGILNPVLFTGEYYKNHPEYDNFTQITISEDLEKNVNRNKKPIKEQPSQNIRISRRSSAFVQQRRSRSDITNWRRSSRSSRKSSSHAGGNRKLTKKLLH